MTRPARLAARLTVIAWAGVLACAGLPARASSSPNGPCPGVSPGLNLGYEMPVVLVHGFNEGPGIWTQGSPSMISAINAAVGRQVHIVSFDYSQDGHNTQWVTDPSIGPALARCINWLAGISAASNGPGNVIIVTHSMGGLAVRCAVSQACLKVSGNGVKAVKPDEIRLLINLDAPNLGPISALSAIGQSACRVLCAGYVGLTGTPGGKAMIGLEPRAGKPTPLAELPSPIPVRAIAGKITLTATLLDAGVFTVTNNLGDIGDGVVPVSSALAESGAALPASGPHTGPGSGQIVEDCGTVSLFTLVGLSSGHSAHLTCFHYPVPLVSYSETTDPAWQSAVVWAVTVAAGTFNN